MRWALRDAWKPLAEKGERGGVALEPSAPSGEGVLRERALALGLY